MLREKSGNYWPYPQEIPYGFKNTWIIEVENIDLSNGDFLSSEVISVLRNNQPTTEAQMREMYDYARDYASLRSAATGSILVAVNEYDEETGLYLFTQIAQQNTTLEGILSLRGEGDIVDNSDPNNPLVRHDVTKLDVEQYTTDTQALNDRLTTDEANIQNNTDAISQLQSGGLTGVTFNGTPANVSDNVADIVADVVSSGDLSTGLSTKVDKNVAGDGGNIVMQYNVLFDDNTRLLTLAKTYLSLETGARTNDVETIDLVDGLGINDLESIDKQLFYFTPTNINANYDNPVTVQLSALYGITPDGTQYTPATTANIKTIYAVSNDYSGIGTIRRRYIAAIGGVQSSTATTLTVAFTNVVQYTLYNKYNSYRNGNIVLDRDTHAFFEVLQTVPLPTAEATIIPLTNTLYYMPITDYTMMGPDTVWANLQPSENAGEAVSVEQMRFALLQLASGYTDFVRFKTNTIPASILTETDWNTHVSLWVTDGYEFTSLDALLLYLANFYTASRYKISNLGIISTRYESGGITINKEYTSDTIATLLAEVFQPLVSGAGGMIPVYGDDGKLVSSGRNMASMATSAQGAKADTAVQSVDVETGVTNGTINFSVDGTSKEVPVAGLGTAAYQPTSAFATEAQGALADTSIQSVSLVPGQADGSIAIVSNGTMQPSVAITGLNTAAYHPYTDFATSAQGGKADTAVQSVQITPGIENGTIQYGVNNGTTTPVNITGLNSAAYQPTTAFASSAQGSRADTALQSSNVVDNLQSTATNMPLSANQGRILDERLQSLGSQGRRIGGFDTYASRYTNTNQYAPDLQPVNVGDTIIIAADENHTNQRAIYSVSAIAGDGTISYAFIEIQPDSVRDFTLSPILSTELANGAVDTAHIQNESVIEADIAPDAVTESRVSQDIRDSLSKANTALQNDITTDGTGAFVKNVSLNAAGGLRISRGNAYDTITPTGTGDFITALNSSGTNISAVKDGIALKTVVSTGSGNVITSIQDSGRNLNVTRGNAISALTVNGNGNVIANLTSAGVATKGTAFMAALKAGTGNVLTGVTANDGTLTFSTGNAYANTNVLGQGNFVKSISPNGSTLDVTLGEAIETLPAASQSTAGITMLVNSLTSTSASRALAANQGRVLNEKIDSLDAGNVKTTGIQTITDLKKFIVHPEVGAKTALPTTPSQTQYATEAQVATRIPRPSSATQNNVAVFDNQRNIIDSGISYETLTPQAISEELSDTYVPQTRRINGHQLTDDVTVTRADVGAVGTVNGVAPDTNGNVNTPPLINNLTTATPGQGALDAYQGYVLEQGKVPLQRSENAAGATVPYYFEIGTAVINGVNGANTKTFVINTTAENVTRPLRFGIFTVSIRNAATSGGNPQAATLQWDICQGFSPDSVRLLWAVSGTSATYKLLFVGDRASEMVHAQVLTHREADNGVWVVNPSPPATTTLPDGYTSVPSTVAQLQPATVGGNGENLLANAYFRNAIGITGNQTGVIATKWNATTNYSSSRIYQFTSNGLSIANTSSDPATIRHDRITKAYQYSNKQVVFSIKMPLLDSSISGNIMSMYVDSYDSAGIRIHRLNRTTTVSEWDSLTDKTFKLTGTLVDLPDNSEIEVIFNCQPNVNYTIESVKLELGSVSTLANDTPPNYNEEFLRTTGASPTQTNPNLIINYQGSINQSGLTEWTAAGYTVDGWRLSSGACMVNVSNSSSLVFTKNVGAGTAGAGFEQLLPNPTDYKGSTLTFSLRYKTVGFTESFVIIRIDDGGVFRTATFSATEEYSVASFTTTLTNGLNGVRIYFNSSTPGNSVIEFDTTRPFAKLELGSVSTLANDGPVDYGTELAKCQRYYQIRSTGDVPEVDLRPSMAKTPVVTQLPNGNYAYNANL